jgi:hypothetical protein
METEDSTRTQTGDSSIISLTVAAAVNDRSVAAYDTSAASNHISTNFTKEK